MRCSDNIFLWKRIKLCCLGLHLHDNHGLRDEHLAIGQGKIEWPPIFEAIKELYNQGLKPELVLEVEPGTDLGELERCYRMITETFGIIC